MILIVPRKHYIKIIKTILKKNDLPKTNSSPSVMSKFALSTTLLRIGESGKDGTSNTEKSKDLITKEK